MNSIREMLGKYISEVDNSNTASEILGSSELEVWIEKWIVDASKSLLERVDRRLGSIDERYSTLGLPIPDALMLSTEGTKVGISTMVFTLLCKKCSE